MNLKKIVYRIKDIILFIIIPVLTFYLLETFLHNPFATMKVKIQFYNMLFYLLLAVFLLCVTGKARIALTIESAFFLVIGLANFYVYRFRSNPILPWDIYSLKTAVSVSENYDYSLSGKTLWTIAGFLALILIGFFGCKLEWKKKPDHSGTVTAVRIAGAVLAAVSIFFYTTALHQDSFIRKLGLYDKLFTADTMQYKDGTSVAFLMELKYLAIHKPDGYSVEKAEALLQSYESDPGNTQEDSSDNPNVIVIMNEAFSDPGILCDFQTNMDYMPFMHSLMEGAQPAITGNLNVSVLGGNTANTEFEFLTGDSMAFLTEGSVAYQQYIHGPISTVLDTFQKLNYSCVAMHPYKSTGWNRNVVYKDMGFDKLLFIDDFTQATYLRKYVDDESCMEMIQKQYEEKQKGQPLFLFNVTMQNHSGYDKAYDNFTPEITVEGVDNLAALQYLSLLKKSDEAFQRLTEYFAAQDEKTILVMFGDHQPSDSVVNPLLALTGQKCSTLTEEQKLNRYKVPFVIWANYDIGTETDVEISANYLSGLVMEKAGLPLSAYQNFLKDLSQRYPVVSAEQVMDAEGNSYHESDLTGELQDYAILEYYNLR